MAGQSFPFLLHSPLSWSWGRLFSILQIRSQALYLLIPFTNRVVPLPTASASVPQPSAYEFCAPQLSAKRRKPPHQAPQRLVCCGRKLCFSASIALFNEAFPIPFTLLSMIELNTFFLFTSYCKFCFLVSIFGWTFFVRKGRSDS